MAHCITWDIRPAWKFTIAVALGLLLILAALAWPGMARSASQPNITEIEVSSSQSSFFYSPPLGDVGGTVYFNSESGEGAGQTITVTVTVSDDNPTTFIGGFAFGVSPSTTISTSYGTTSTWSVTYTIHSGDPSQNGVLFTITNGSDFDAVPITFTQDNVDPTVSFPAILENSPYLHAIGSSGIYYGDQMPTAIPFTVTGQAGDSGVGLLQATFSTALGDSPPADTTPSTWTAVYSASNANTSSGNILATLHDKVGNTATQTFVYTRDTGGPETVPDFTLVPDADSGDDGFAPDTKWEDDLTADFTWSVASDDDGSGVAGYQLSSDAPFVTAFYTTTSGSLTVLQEGSYNFNIRAKDNVGNSGSLSYINSVSFDSGVPFNGDLTLQEQSGGQYLFIAGSTSITSGTLFYNNTAASTFRVTANTPGDFEWGGLNSQGWKVAFSPGWGESSITEVTGTPYRHDYTIDPLETTDVFTVSYVNRAGNISSIPISAELDTSGPVITFTQVTAPNWQNGGVAWYRTGSLASGWRFTTTVTSEQAGVDPNVGRATWNHSVGTTHDQSKSAPGGDGVFTNVSDDPNGTVVVTVVVTDQVSNASSVATTFNLDGTAPVITPTGWSETSDFLHIVGGQLFFSHAMPGSQSATVSGSAADNPDGSGLERAAFSQEANLAGSPGDDLDPDQWSGSYSFASGSTAGDGLATVTLYDRVGNSAAANFEYIEDATPPSMSISNVTGPGYDPDGDRLNDEGNWYASSDLDGGPGANGWLFFFSSDDSQTGLRSASADWDHSNDAYDQLGYNPGLDGAGLFGTGGGGSGSAVNDDADGVVTATLRIEDNVGNVGSDRVTLRIDNTPPIVTSGAWSENSPYLHANGSILYFSHQMTSARQATLSGQANDGTGSGLERASFSNESNLASSPPADTTPENWAGIYSFSSSSGQGDGRVDVTLTDHLAHPTTRVFTYVLDAIPPTTPDNFSIATPPVTGNYYNTRSLNLSWMSSTDNITGSGLAGYYLRTDSSSSYDFYPPPSTAATYNVGSDGTFTFFLEARDQVFNIGPTNAGPVIVDTAGPLGSITATREEANRRCLIQWSASDATTWPVSYDVHYRVNGGAWTPWLNATTATSRYFGPNDPTPIQVNVAYDLRVRARDVVNNVGPWSEPAAQCVLTRRFAYLPALVRNFDTSIPFAVLPEGFENGNLNGWQTGGVLPVSIVPNPPPSGNDAVLLGSPSYGCAAEGGVPIGQRYIRAYVSVPAGSGTPWLRFDYRVLSYDVVQGEGGEPFDRLEVQVNGTTLARYGGPLRSVSCSNLYDSGRKTAEFNLSAYKGQTVLLTFFNENHQDSSWNTYSYLDNIRIEVQ